MKNTEIGVVTTNYDEQGKLISANFKPTMQVELSDSVKRMLDQALQKDDNVESLKRNSDFVLGSFFSKMTEIELADREDYEIVSEILDCHTYENGKVKFCRIKYLFAKRVRATAQA